MCFPSLSWALTFRSLGGHSGHLPSCHWMSCVSTEVCLGKGQSPGKDVLGSQWVWVCENPWAEKDTAMLGTAESCSSGALPQGAGAGATLGVVTEL